MENNLSRISDQCYISLNNNMPGIVGLFINDPEHGKILSELAEYLLKGEHELPIPFRELVATHVSRLNNCNFCYNSHKEIALASSSDTDKVIIENALNFKYEFLDVKYQALLAIAAIVATRVQVHSELIAQAKRDGVTDAELLRTVQIASAFCMYNRYVDGLGTIPGTSEYYKQAGENIAKVGYIKIMEEEPNSVV